VIAGLAPFVAVAILPPDVPSILVLYQQYNSKGKVESRAASDPLRYDLECSSNLSSLVSLIHYSVFS
jgi:hypothetical protein